MNYHYRMLYWLLAFLTAGAAYAQDRALMVNEPRVALVIGNATYKVGPLKNPGNDAEDIAAALRNLGFRVTLRKDATQRQMVDAIAEFGKELRKGGVGLFYFAGHGVQSRGANFLIPVNADVSSEAQLEYDTINAARVLSEMDSAGNRVNIMILDACRDNPFARSFRSSSRGLVAMEAAKGTYISFATGPGSVAADGAGRNGVYTEQLLRSLQQPESEVDRVFRRVAADVTRATGGKQSPWGSHNLTGDFYFKAGGGTAVAFATPTVPADPRADDRALWDTVNESSSPAELEAYLDQFPKGIFAGVARARLKTLAAPAPASKPAPPKQVAVAPPTTPAPRPAPAVSASATPDYSPGSTFRDACEACPEMVVIPPGSFIMGSPAGEQGRDSDEGPQRSVNIPRALAVGKYEVTRGEYAQFVRETNRSSGGCRVPKDGKFQEDPAASWQAPGYAQNDTHPVACVNWDDAKAYVAWLSRKSGGNYRLLSEAEWEYAARAGTATAYYWGDNSSNNCQYANGADQTFKTAFTGAANIAACADNHTYTAPVGTYQANAFGLHDMSGNVFEWTEDCWNENYNGAPTQGVAWTSGDCGQRVLRGGSWLNNPQGLRSALRDWFTVSYRLNGSGFRVARTL